MSAPTRIANEYLTVDVSSLGAEMQAMTTRDGLSWLWNGDAAFWGGRSPILFPIVGKAPDDKVAVNGQSFPMGQHGFARRSEFTLAQSTATMCLYELTASEETKSGYPFDFRLAVEHSIEGRALTVAAEVTNLDKVTMPFGIGFHSAFVWPLPDSAGAEHRITLDNGAEPALARLAGGLIKDDRLESPFESGRLVLDHRFFEEDAMIFPEGTGEGLVYGAENGPSLRFRFDNLPNLALWTKPGAPFICIEPWHGMAARKGGSGEISERPYNNSLPSGASARFSFTVEISV